VWIYGLVIIICFLAYELSEDWRIKDHAYIDIRGFPRWLCSGHRCD
jgi:hypothetical protein